MTMDDAVRLIKSGEIVAFPTETVYGLGADALNPDAVKKIFVAKGRPSDNPLIIHIADKLDADDFAVNITIPVRRLMESFWPGPLTLVLEKQNQVPDIVTGGLATVALRVPDHPVALELIRKSCALAAPSANISGRPSATSSRHVRQDFGPGLALLKGEPAKIGVESTVLDVTTTPYRLLRPGKITAGQISRISGEAVVAGESYADKPAAPGMKYTHYRPAARVVWYGQNGDADKEKTLLVTHSITPGGYTHHRFFNGDFDAFAKELFDLFRTADRLHLRTIAIEPLPEDSTHPLTGALRNRITKAAG